MSAVVGRVVGLGHALAGDDAVGLAVVAHLRGRGAPVEAREARDPTEVIALLAHDGPVAIVDALLGPPAGTVEEIALSALDPTSPFRASSHGLGLFEAIALARALAPARFTPRLGLVGVAIDRPTRGRAELSPEVAAAVPRAAAVALALVAPRLHPRR